jgi:PTS system mannose-specific IIB component/fructoselysine and glucoselysine-specific PTS system IIB component
MSIRLFRIDDRLIHGQVVVGWGQPLGVGFIVLVDNEVRASDWEQDLYRMGVPPEIEVVFWQSDQRTGILLTGDIDTMAAISADSSGVRRVNIGGLHHRPGRRERLRYVYLSDDELQKLRGMAARGIEITAQDVPTARAIPLEELG